MRRGWSCLCRHAIVRDRRSYDTADAKVLGREDDMGESALAKAVMGVVWKKRMWWRRWGRRADGQAGRQEKSGWWLYEEAMGVKKGLSRAL